MAPPSTVKRPQVIQKSPCVVRQKPSQQWSAQPTASLTKPCGLLPLQPDATPTCLPIFFWWPDVNAVRQSFEFFLPPRHPLAVSSDPTTMVIRCLRKLHFGPACILQRPPRHIKESRTEAVSNLLICHVPSLKKCIPSKMGKIPGTQKTGIPNSDIPGEGPSNRPRRTRISGRA